MIAFVLIVVLFIATYTYQREMVAFLLCSFHSLASISFTFTTCGRSSVNSTKPTDNKQEGFWKEAEIALKAFTCKDL